MQFESHIQYCMLCTRTLFIISFRKDANAQTDDLFLMIRNAAFVACAGRKKRMILIDPLTKEEMEVQHLNEKAVTRTQRYTTQFHVNKIL